MWWCSAIKSETLHILLAHSRQKSDSFSMNYFVSMYQTMCHWHFGILVNLFKYFLMQSFRYSGQLGKISEWALIVFTAIFKNKGVAAFFWFAMSVWLLNPWRNFTRQIWRQWHQFFPWSVLIWRGMTFPRRDFCTSHSFRFCSEKKVHL